MKLDTGRKANLYFDIKDIDFKSNITTVNLKALRNIRPYEGLVINPTANHNFTVLRQATHATALYVEQFGYRGVPGKFRNRKIMDILNKPEIHGFWTGRGTATKSRKPFDPRRIDHDEEDDDNGNDGNDDDGNGDDGNGDDGNGDDGNGDDGNGNIDNGNPNLNNGNQGNSNLTQTPINNNLYNPIYNAIRQLGLTNFYKNFNTHTNDIMNEILYEIANESLDEQRQNMAWAEQHNVEVDHDQEMRQQAHDQITKWLKHARFRRT